LVITRLGIVHLHIRKLCECTFRHCGSAHSALRLLLADELGAYWSYGQGAMVAESIASEGGAAFGERCLTLCRPTRRLPPLRRLPGNIRRGGTQRRLGMAGDHKTPSATGKPRTEALKLGRRLFRSVIWLPSISSGFLLLMTQKPSCYDAEPGR